MKIHKLASEKRGITGKKVKKLRKQGIIPANIYGKSVKSVAVSINKADFDTVYEQAGETGLIELTLKGEKSPHHVLIHGVQLHPVTDTYLHVDLHEVALKEKIQVPVPLTFTGESPVVAQKNGVLIQLMDEVTVEALPTELPEEITVDISKLEKVGDEIKVGDLAAGKVKIINDADEAVARINELEKEEAPAPAPAATEEAPVAEGAEKPTEPAEEKAPEEKKE